MDFVDLWLCRLRGRNRDKNSKAMANKGFHKSHSSGTKTKLEIFDRYFKESLPVFIHSPFFEDIYIYDLFAGKGKDENGSAFGNN